MNPRRPSALRTLLPALVVLFLVSSAQAQEAGQPTPDQRRQAGAAYDSAVAARAAGNHASAASFFETADRIVPSPQALGNAIRSHRDARQPSEDARAATLALRMLTRYGDQPRAAEYAQTVIQELSPTLTRVRVTCEGCDLEVDHANASETEFFLEPGDHHIVGYWGSRTAARDVSAVAGESDQVILQRPVGAVASSSGPPGSHASSSPGPSSGSPGPGGGQATAASGVFPMVVPVIAAILTIGSGAVLAWSAADMYGGVAAYMACQTAACSDAALMTGQGTEVRTDILIGATIGLGVITIATLLLRKHGGDHVEVAPTAATATGMVPGLTIGGRF